MQTKYSSKILYISITPIIIIVVFVSCCFALGFGTQQAQCLVRKSEQHVCSFRFCGMNMDARIPQQWCGAACCSVSTYYPQKGWNHIFVTFFPQPPKEDKKEMQKQSGCLQTYTSLWPCRKVLVKHVVFFGWILKSDDHQTNLFCIQFTFLISIGTWVVDDGREYTTHKLLLG